MVSGKKIARCEEICGEVLRGSLLHKSQHPFGVILKGEDDGAEAFEEFFPALEFDVEAVRREFDAFRQVVVN